VGEGWDPGARRTIGYSPAVHLVLDAYLLLIISVMPLFHHQWCYIYHQRSLLLLLFSQSSNVGSRRKGRLDIVRRWRRIKVMMEWKEPTPPAQ
jgi:hypothetical protein